MGDPDGNGIDPESLRLYEREGLQWLDVDGIRALIPDMPKCVRPKGRVRQALLRWVALAHDGLKQSSNARDESDQASNLNVSAPVERDHLERLAKQVAKLKKVVTDLEQIGTAKEQLAVVFVDLLQPGRGRADDEDVLSVMRDEAQLDKALAGLLDPLHSAAIAAAKEVQISPGRNPADFKRATLEELIYIWRWATGRRTLGTKFEAFARLVITSALGEGAEKNFEIDIKILRQRAKEKPLKALAYLRDLEN